MLRFVSLNLRLTRFRRLMLPLFLLVTASPLFAAPPPPPPPQQIVLVPTLIANGFSNGGGIAFDSAGNLYIADFGNGAVKEIEAVNGVIPSHNPVVKTLSSGFNQPYDVAIDSKGNVFVVDYAVEGVYEIVASGVGVFPVSPTIRQLAWGAPALANSTSIAVDSHGNLFIGSDTAQTVEEIAATSVGVYPQKVNLTAVDANFTAVYPDGVAVDSNGNLFVADGNTNDLSEIGATSVGAYPAQPTVTTLASGYTYLATVRADGNGNLFYADYAPEGGVYELSSAGVGVYPQSPAINQLGAFAYPWSAAPDSLGNVFVMVDLTYSSEASAHKVRGFATQNNQPQNPAQVFEIMSGNFGSLPVGTTSLAQTLTFQVAANTPIGSIAVLTQGSPSLDFASAAGGTCTAKTYSSATTCTVNVTFSPKLAGSRSGAVVFSSGPRACY